MKYFSNLRSLKLPVLFLSFVLLSACCGQGNHLLRNDKENIVHAMRATVALVHERDPIDVLLNPDDPREYDIYCSAFFINSRTIVTAAHCVLDENDELDTRKIMFVKYGEINDRGVLTHGVHWANVYKWSAKKDIAILRLVKNEPSSRHHFSLPVNGPQAGQQIFVIGHPGGLPFVYTQGFVSRIWAKNNMLKPGVRLIQTQAPVWFGNSGGILFDQNNNALGVASFIMGRQAVINCFVDAREIKSLLK